jgi:hypothetical protein
MEYATGASITIQMVGLTIMCRMAGPSGTRAPASKTTPERTPNPPGKAPDSQAKSSPE